MRHLKEWCGEEEKSRGVCLVLVGRYVPIGSEQVGSFLMHKTSQFIKMHKDPS